MNSISVNEVFDTRISNQLIRNGKVETIDDLRQYIIDHPYGKRRRCTWYRISRKTFEFIDYIVNIELRP